MVTYKRWTGWRWLLVSVGVSSSSSELEEADSGPPGRQESVEVLRTLPCRGKADESTFVNFVPILRHILADPDMLTLKFDLSLQVKATC